MDNNKIGKRTLDEALEYKKAVEEVEEARKKAEKQTIDTQKAITGNMPLRLVELVNTCLDAEVEEVAARTMIEELANDAIERYAYSGGYVVRDIALATVDANFGTTASCDLKHVFSGGGRGQKRWFVTGDRPTIKLHRLADHICPTPESGKFCSVCGKEKELQQ